VNSIDETKKRRPGSKRRIREGTAAAGNAVSREEAVGRELMLKVRPSSETL